MRTRAVGIRVTATLAGLALAASLALLVLLVSRDPDAMSVAADTAPAESGPPHTARNEVAEPQAAGVGGYSGTRRERLHLAGETDDADRAWPRGSRDRGFFAAPDELPMLAPLLAEATSYPRFLRIMYRLGGEPTRPGHEFRDAERSPGQPTHFRTHPDEVHGVLLAALERAPSGMARQALIFHLAVALPPEIAFPRLRELAAGADPDDAEDATCALAFAGDPDALAAFERAASVPSSADVRRPIHSERDMRRVESQGDRAVLRSYRCIEVLDRRPYFHIHGLEYDAPHAAFPWARPRSPDGPAALRLLTAWLARYPGHCGSDDMAYRIARHHLEAGNSVDALRWASRAAAEPDRDMRHAAIGMLVSLIALSPPGDPVTEHVIDPEHPERNRNLLLYARTFRRARTQGCSAALRELEQLALREPELDLAAAYRDRWSAPVPRGLDSGDGPLAAGDALLRVVPRESVTGAQQTTRWAYRNRALSVAPQDGDHGVAEVVAMRPDRLRTQFRAWETLAELERRADVATPHEALNLLYKQGAIYFHDMGVMYPAYAVFGQTWSGRPSPYWLRRDAATGRAAHAYRRDVLHWNRAIERFEELLRRDPGHPLADDALYSIGLAHVKAVDTTTVQSDGADERKRHLRAGSEALATMSARYPDSPLTPPATAAAAYWRRTWHKVFD